MYHLHFEEESLTLINYNKILQCNNDFLLRQDLSELNISYNFPASHWTPEKGYPPDTVNNALPWRPNGQGVHMGLTIVVDAEIHQYYCSSENSVGFKVIIIY